MDKTWFHGGRCHEHDFEDFNYRHRLELRRSKQRKNEESDIRDRLIPGPGQTAAFTHPTSDRCTGPLLTQRSATHPRSCPKLLPMPQDLSFSKLNFLLPEPNQTPQNLFPSTKFIKMFPGKLSRIRSYSQILGVGSLEADPERKKFAGATPLGRCGT